MDELPFVVVPATVAPTFSLYKTSIPAPLPELSKPSVERERNSSENTIVTIYSMYGDDDESWSPPNLVDHDDSSQKFRQSFLRSSQNTIEDSAYYESSYDPNHLSTQSSSMNRTSNGAYTAFTDLTDSSRERKLATSPVPSRPPSSTRSDRLPPPEPSPFQPRSQPNSRRGSPVASSATSPYLSPISLHPSLVAPFEGEDLDSFHVRKTYAALEQLGVKGDGYLEGVERTRAKIGASRTSELQAMDAIGDETEKKRDLTPREIEMLSSLDRYGFLTVPSHDRLMSLASESLSRTLSPLAPVVNNVEPSMSPLQAQPAPPSPKKEVSRALKWGRMLEVRLRDPGGNVALWSVKAAKEPKLRDRVYKGIPDCWRSAVWEMLSIIMTKGSRQDLERYTTEYETALEKPSTYDIQIDLDVPRTISGHVMFRTRYGQGQRSLFHVLHSFSLRCQQCGYCQGMGPIAATLLSYMDPPRAYASLIRLHDSYSMHSIFTPGFPGLLEAIYVQEQIMQQMMPGVYAAFKQHMISTTSYATKWYITLFSNTVPFHTQLRLWDVFFLEGSDLFVIMAVAIVWVYRDQITSSLANFETVLSLLSSFFVPEDDNVLLGWIDKVMNDSKIRTNMQQWRAEWKQLVATGQDSQALL